MRVLISRSASFLSAAQKSFYNTQGYLVLPDLIPISDLERIKERALELIDSWEPSSDPSVFSTKEQARTTDDYFMESASNISFFLEEKPGSTKETSINKIGHAMHDLDPVFQKFSYRREYKQILSDLGYLKPAIVQSMYIMKPPGIGGEVMAHQDRSFIISEPASCIGIWVAIEDANIDNACMFVNPGSHLQGTQMFWERTTHGMKFTNEVTYETSKFECLEARAGTVVLLHGDVVHWSQENRSDKSRHAYTLHVVETQDTVWSARNWLQRKDSSFNIFE